MITTCLPHIATLTGCLTAYAKSASKAEIFCRVRGLLAEALDLPADWFEPRFQEPLMTLRPIHYTAEQSSPTDGVFGCGAHTGMPRRP